MAPSQEEGADFVEFLARRPAAPGSSHEVLGAAIQSLIRERDYLRRIRDLQLAEQEREVGDLQQHVKELERALESEAVAARGQAAELNRELAEHRTLVADLERECQALRADRDDWRRRARWARFKARVRGWLESKWAR